MADKEKTKFEIATEKRIALRKRLGDFFNTDAGRELLADLEAAFDPDELRGDDPVNTYFNLGARAVVRHLRDLRDSAKKE